MQATPEQQEIVRAVSSGENLLVSALAGTEYNTSTQKFIT